MAAQNGHGARTDDCRVLSECEVLEQEYVDRYGPFDCSTPSSQGKPEDSLAAIRDALHQRKPSALCLSGGGIRSATFGLGILQGLAKAGVLDQFTYLSTVSGGGYIGGWLSAWMHRDKGAGPGVANQLGQSSTCGESEPHALKHLREYSNFLTPRVGLLSMDTWAALGIYLRNVLINWTILVPLMVGVVMLPMIYDSLILPSGSLTHRFPQSIGGAAHFLGWFSGMIALAYATMRRPSVGRGSRRAARPEPERSPAESVTRRSRNIWRKISFFQDRAAGFWIWCLAPLLYSVFCLTGFWLSVGFSPNYSGIISLLLTLAFIMWIRIGTLSPFRILLEAICFALSGTLWYRLEFEVLSGFATLRHSSWRDYYCFAPSASLLCLLVAASLFVALTSRWTDDDDREWWGRFGGYLLLIAGAWAALAFVAIAGPDIIRYAKFGAWAKAAYALILGSGGGALLAGHSRRTPVDGASDKPGRLPISIAAIASILGAIFLIFLLCFQAWLLQILTRWRPPIPIRFFPGRCWRRSSWARCPS